MSKLRTEKICATGCALRIVIAGGSTGGHLFPGIAIAQEFMARNPENKVIFISTGKPFETDALSRTVFELKCITSEAIKGRGLRRQARAILKIPKGIFESIRIMNRFRPHLVIGMGSYSSGAVIMGAWLMGIKIVLHEQNILPGITNRMLAPFAGRIYVSFENTKAGGTLGFALWVMKKVLVTGNPVRNEILQCAKEQNNKATTDPGKTKHFTVLIIGGSQGAHSINTAVMETVKYLKEKKRFYFIHQTGVGDEMKVENAYASQGISCSVKSFFNDMAMQYRKADLVICRAGATTVAEVTVMGKGVIFIPYPFAADNHQVLNARTLTNVGAAEMILQNDLEGKTLAERVEYYSSDAGTLGLMASKAKNSGRPDAAKTIVDDCYGLEIVCQ